MGTQKNCLYEMVLLSTQTYAKADEENILNFALKMGLSGYMTRHQIVKCTSRIFVKEGRISHVSISGVNFNHNPSLNLKVYFNII